MIKALIRKILLSPIAPSAVLNRYRVKLEKNGIENADRSLENMRNILVVKQDGIGDAILLIQFMRLLRKSAPSAHICIVASHITKSLWDNCPYVDERYYLDNTGHGLFSHYRNYIRSAKFSRKVLCRRMWDLGIVPRWGIDTYYSTYIPVFCLARQRVGFSESVTLQRSIWNRGYDKLLTMAIKTNRVEHESKQNLNIIRAMSGNTKNVSMRVWKHNISSLVVELRKMSAGRMILALSPGARDAKRIWPIERVSAIAGKLQKEIDVFIVIVGGGDDDDISEGREIEKACAGGASNYVGKTSIMETIDILKECDLFIGNDSSPLHMACFAGIPVIEISCQPKVGDNAGTNSPVRFGPWSIGSVVIQPEYAKYPCLLKCDAHTAHCICGVSETDVFCQAMNMLETNKKE